MKQVRLLVIGDEQLGDSLRGGLIPHDIDVVVTSLTREEVYPNDDVGYIVSDRGLELLRAATPALYDAIIIGNDLGVGEAYASVVPEAMKSCTMIVWNSYRAGLERRYAELGFILFGNRHPGEEFVLFALAFVEGVAAGLP